MAVMNTLEALKPYGPALIVTALIFVTSRWKRVVWLAGAVRSLFFALASVGFYVRNQEDGWFAGAFAILAAWEALDAWTDYRSRDNKA